MSLFNKPAWAKSQAVAADVDEAVQNDNDIFSHSNRSYREIVAEQERRKQAKAEKQKQKEERRNSGKRVVVGEAYRNIDSKRRRVSLQDDDDDGNEHEILVNDDENVDVDVDTGIGFDDEFGEVAVGSPQDKAPIRRSLRKNKYDHEDNMRTWAQNTKTPVVELGESDSEADQAVARPLAPVEVVDEESDDEFAALARRAREQRQRASYTKTSQTPDLAAHSPSPGSGLLDTGQDRPATPPPDPTIQLFISSSIEGTNPMIVYRKLSQNIAQIRRVWCERQGFSEEVAMDVFFIHRMRRVYDVTTCRSLGIEVDSLGNLVLKGAEGKENVDKVHLEAVTEDTFRQMKAEKAKEAQRQNDDLQPGADTEDDQGLAEPPKEHSFIRLLLKAKGKEDFKLKVKPTTTFSRIVAAYAKTHLSGGQSARLEFDGEKLDPEDEVQNTEISDMDCIDVHILSR